MNDDDYREIFAYIRELLKEHRLADLDERILGDLNGRQGAFSDLRGYLKLLRGEISLGSNTRFSSTLRRFKRYVRTEDGSEIAGLRLKFTDGDQDRVNQEFVDLVPDIAFTKLAAELDEIMKILDDDYKNGDQQNR